MAKKDSQRFVINIVSELTEEQFKKAKKILLNNEFNYDHGRKWFECNNYSYPGPIARAFSATDDLKQKIPNIKFVLFEGHSVSNFF